MTKRELLKKIISKIFPEFTNKLTGAVVSAGLLLVGSSLIEQIIRTWINSELSWSLTDGNDAVVGVVLIGLGLLHNYGYVREKNRPIIDPLEVENQRKRDEHDIQIFRKLDKYINEDQVKLKVDFILTNHSYFSIPEDPMKYFCNEGNKQENKYINTAVEDAKLKLHRAVKDFLNFLSNHFYDHGPIRDPNKIYMCMEPHWNIDRGGNPSSEERRKYDQLTKQLIDLGEEVETEFDKYRSIVKSAYAV